MTDLQMITQFLPIRWQPYVPMGIMLTVILCKAVTALVAPPAPTSRWLRLYTVINKIAMNSGWAANAYQPGLKAILVDKDADRCVIKEKLGIPPEVNTKP